MDKPKLILSELVERFKKSENPVRAKQQQVYMKNKMEYWGYSSGETRLIAAHVFKLYPPNNKDEYRRILLYLFKHGTRREEWYAAVFMARKYKKFIIPELINTYVEIVKISQWWDIVDSVASNLIGPALRDKELRDYLIPWIQDENMWIRRTALLTQLNYKDLTDFPLLKELILQVAHEQEFFIRKAIGWALRQYSYTNPKAVLRLIVEKGNQLSNLSIREAQKGMKRIGYIND
ncbi:MAG: DNA alkylation repair protein [Fidelibacterota bacterium]